jgi:hypothetical protein
MNARPNLNTIHYPIPAEKPAFPLPASRPCAENIPQLVNTPSTDFRYFIANLWFLLFFIASASKTLRLLITAYGAKPNPIRTNFESNVVIATFGGVLSLRAADASLKTVMPKNKLSQTEACCPFAPPTERRAVTSRRRQRGVLSLRAADREACFVHLPQCFGEGARGWGFSVAEMLFTNRIQREFLFNNGIQS